MQPWKWFGMAVVLLSARAARAEASAAFPSQSPTTGVVPSAPSQPASAEPAVHTVAPQQQREAPIQPATEPARSLPPRPEPPEEEVTRWYGGYTLASDGLSLAMAFTGLAAEPDFEPLFWTAGAGYLLGAPIVHLAHGNPGRALASLGLRAGLPIAFFGAGLTAEDCTGRDFCGVGSFIVGVPLGMATAIALDSALLARDTVKRPLDFVPTAAITPNGASIGLGGSF